MTQCHRHYRSCNHGFQPMGAQSADEVKCRRHDSGSTCLYRPIESQYSSN